MHFWHKNHNFGGNMHFSVPGTRKRAQNWPTLLLDQENKWFATTANVGIPWFSSPRNTVLEIFRKMELRYGRNTFSFHLSVPRGPDTQNIVLPMLFYILWGVSGVTGRIYIKKWFFQKNEIPIILFHFRGILNSAIYFLFLLKFVTRTNTCNP